MARCQFDTCGCAFEFIDGPGGKDDHVVLGALPCPEHRRATPQETWDAVIAENRKKNAIVGEILLDPLFGTDFTDKGETVRLLKEGLEMSFDYDKDRNLIINFPQSLKREIPRVESEIGAKLDLTKVILR